jgi:hypothetical protein
MMAMNTTYIDGWLNAMESFIGEAKSMMDIHGLNDKFETIVGMPTTMFVATYGEMIIWSAILVLGAIVFLRKPPAEEVHYYNENKDYKGKPKTDLQLRRERVPSDSPVEMIADNTHGDFTGHWLEEKLHYLRLLLHIPENELTNRDNVQANLRPVIEGVNHVQKEVHNAIDVVKVVKSEKITHATSTVKHDMHNAIDKMKAVLHIPTAESTLKEEARPSEHAEQTASPARSPVSNGTHTPTTPTVPYTLDLEGFLVRLCSEGFVCDRLKNGQTKPKIIRMNSKAELYFSKAWIKKPISLKLLQDAFPTDDGSSFILDFKIKVLHLRRPPKQYYNNVTIAKYFAMLITVLRKKPEYLTHILKESNRVYFKKMGKNIDDKSSIASFTSFSSETTNGDVQGRRPSLGRPSSSYSTSSAMTPIAEGKDDA